MRKEKPIKPEYLAWRRRVEGQIRHMINEHPEYFDLPTEDAKARCIRSMAKRIIGEIVAGTPSGNNPGGDATSSVPAWRKMLCNFWSAVLRTAGGIPTAGRPSQSQHNN